MDRQNRPLCLNTEAREKSNYIKQILQPKNVYVIYKMCILTSFIQPSVHDAVFDLHVSGEVSLQCELARAVEAFEGFTV